jgi:hypothetical protein
MATEIDVMERAVEGHSVHWRRLLFAFAVLVVVSVPLAAIGAANDWWFLNNGGAPVPTSAPQVVKEGEWDGQPWQLIAYPSATHGLCVSITPKDSGTAGEGGAVSCGPFVGFESKASPATSITFLAGGGSAKLPAYIAGPVVAEASVVEVRFGGGKVLRVPTVAGPEPLHHVRFYVAQLPTEIQLTIQLTPGTAISSLSSVAGLDPTGRVVACLAPQALAKTGVSSLSDCS